MIQLRKVKYRKSLTSKKPARVLFTETTSSRKNIPANTPNGNMIKANAARNKFQEYLLLHILWLFASKSKVRLFKFADFLKSFSFKEKPEVAIWILV